MRKLGNSVGLQTRNADEAGQTENQQGGGKSSPANRRLGTPVHRQDDWIGCSSSLLLVPPTAPLADFCW